MQHNKLFKAGQSMIFPHAQLRMFPTWPQFHLPLFFFDWTLCNATSIFFTYSKTFSRQPDSHWKNPHHQKLLREDAIVLYHVKKKRTLEKVLRDLCPQNHFLAYFVREREDEQSQFFNNICCIHSKVIL